MPRPIEHEDIYKTHSYVWVRLKKHNEFEPARKMTIHFHALEFPIDIYTSFNWSGPASDFYEISSEISPPNKETCVNSEYKNRKR